MRNNRCHLWRNDQIDDAVALANWLIKQIFIPLKLNAYPKRASKFKYQFWTKTRGEAGLDKLILGSKRRSDWFFASKEYERILYPPFDQGPLGLKWEIPKRSFAKWIMKNELFIFNREGNEPWHLSNLELRGVLVPFFRCWPWPYSSFQLNRG